jgi:hypothetical protein
MICDAPTEALAPPTWQLKQDDASEPVVALGFGTLGTEEQLTKLATVVQRAGLVCGTQDAGEGQLKMLVFFGPQTTRQQAFDIFNRVEQGEFGTSATQLILVPAQEAHKG